MRRASTESAGEIHSHDFQVLVVEARHQVAVLEVQPPHSFSDLRVELVHLLVAGIVHLRMV